MAIFTTKIALNNSKYYQLTGDTLSLSGTTFIGKVLYIKDVSSTYNDRSIIDKGYLDHRLLTFSGSSSVFVSGATNGLTLLNKNIELGGTLTKETDIDTYGNIFSVGELSNFGPWISINPTNFSLELTNYHNATDYSTIREHDLSIELTTSITGKTATYILNQNGLHAVNNYFSGNTNNPRWIPDKEYVDTHSITGYTFNNGITNNSNTVRLGGNVKSDIYLHSTSNNFLFYETSDPTNTINNTQFFVGTNQINNEVSLSGSSAGTILDYSGLSYLDNVSNKNLNNPRWIPDKEYIDIKSSGITNTFNNGLINTSGNIIQLGGSLSKATNINLNNNNLSFSNGRVISSGTTGQGFDSYNDYKLSGTTFINTAGRGFDNGNIAVGYQALFNNTTGINNIGIGYSALRFNTSGKSNIGIGTNALINNISGSSNIVIGNNAASRNSCACNNIAIGDSALCCNTLMNNHIAIGTQALSKNTTGCDNLAIGSFSLGVNTSGSCNFAIGNQTLTNNTTGCNNVAFGFASLSGNTTGCDNLAVGSFSLDANTTGACNIGIGNQSLTNNTTGINNTALGFASLCTNLTGNNNVGLGFSAGKYETASNTIYIDNIDRTSIALGKTNSLLYGVTNSSPSAQTLTTNSKFTATYGVNIPTGNTYTIGNNNIQNHYLETTISGNTTLIGNEYVIYGDNSALAYIINLPLNPIKGTAFKIKDIGGNAAVNNITISGNTRNINNSSTSLINTNYGAVEIIYNIKKNKWYTLSFAN
jgi:hypothetical protein